MEHNTLIRYGFAKRVEQKVFDPEIENHFSEHNIIHPKFEFDEPKQKSAINQKGKSTNDDVFCKKNTT
jgi:hypothetical protein